MFSSSAWHEVRHKSNVTVQAVNHFIVWGTMREKKRKLAVNQTKRMQLIDSNVTGWNVMGSWKWMQFCFSLRRRWNNDVRGSQPFRGDCVNGLFPIGSLAEVHKLDCEQTNSKTLWIHSCWFEMNGFVFVFSVDSCVLFIVSEHTQSFICNKILI